MIFIGIDPGISGAVASIDSVTGEIHILDTPVLEIVVNGKKKHLQDLMAITLLLQQLTAREESLVTIEKVNAMPGTRADGERHSMGATSAFNFGRGFGNWEGIVAALMLSSQQVHPATWKKLMMADMGKGKDASRIRAMQMFPRAAKDLQRKMDHGRAEALLMAAYGMRVNGHGLPREASLFLEQEEKF